MTTEELILGHFDKALTPNEESQLQQTLKGSPEARVLYDQHAALDGMLASDVASLAPSAGLDKLAIAGALGAVPEAIGGGGSATGWLGGKVAAGIAAILVGGASIALITSSGSKQNATPAANVPAAQPAPAVSAPTTVATPELPKSDGAAETAKPATEVPPVVKKIAKAERKEHLATARRKSDPTLKLDPRGTNVETPLKVKPSGSK